MTRERKKIGLPPGSVIFTGDQKVEKVFVHHLKYDEQSLEEVTLDNRKNMVINLSKDEIVDWYDIRGLHDIKLIESLGKTFNIHSLVLEDIVDVHQRPKFEEYEQGVFITFRALSFDKSKLEISKEHVAIYFRQGLILSFQETGSDLFSVVRQRIHNGRGRIRKKGADYLVFAILDVIVDHYYIILDELESVIEALESDLLDKPDSKIKERIHLLKKELLSVRKSVAPLREAIGRFSKSEVSFIEESTAVYIRDLYDHTIQVMDMVETYRDMLNGLQDLYLSEISFKMNQVMQVLAVITTIFVPLSFLAGLYGMNFEYIPELKFKYGYFGLLGVMFCIFLGSLYYFRKKNWF